MNVPPPGPLRIGRGASWCPARWSPNFKATGRGGTTRTAALPRLAAAVASLLFSAVGPAQDAVSLPTRASAPDVIETASETIQFFGLKKWSAQAILDSLSARFPGGIPSASLCAAHLVQILKF